YGPSKAALIMLVRVLAQELGRDGIRVNALSPGMVRTGMTAKVYADPRIAAERDALVPLGRVATPEDMADVIAFLLSPDARYVNGHDPIVDGGVSGNLLGRLPGLSQITRGLHARLSEGGITRGEPSVWQITMTRRPRRPNETERGSEFAPLPVFRVGDYLRLASPVR